MGKNRVLSHVWVEGGEQDCKLGNTKINGKC